MNSMFSELKENSIYNKKCLMLIYCNSTLGPENIKLDFIYKTRIKHNILEYAIFKIHHYFWAYL